MKPQSFRSYLDRMLEYAMIILMGLLVLTVVWQVFSRYCLPNASSFTDELAGFLLIWVGLTGAAYVKGKNQHLAIDLLHERLSPLNKKRLHLFIHFLIILFSVCVMLIGGCWLVYTRFYLGQVSPSMQLPIGAVYAIIPLSGLLMIYYAVDDIRLLLYQK